MSYIMKQVETSFFINKSNLEAAYAALLDDVITSKWLDLLDVHTFVDAVYEYRWSLEFDNEGNVCHIKRISETEAIDETLFDAIAPYVKARSYIQMVSADGRIWRWTFDGKNYSKKELAISW